MTKPLIYDLSTPALKQVLDELKQPGFRLKQLQQGLYNKLYDNFDQFAAMPKAFRQVLAERFTINPLQVAKRLVSKDGNTEKLLFELVDDKLIETVLMRFERRNTLCVSTQVGCPMGCVFCATGQMGYQRNLSAGEILSQIIFFQRQLHSNGEALRNIVYMGMGEPFLNYSNVSQSLQVLSDPEKIGLGARRITVSTVGIIPRIPDFGCDHPQANLAISLHAPDDELRSQILPANRQYPLDKLMLACRDYIAQTNRKLTFEYALIAGLNDSDAHAHQFARLIKGMLCIVNLITLNPSKSYPTPGSSQDRVQAFRNILVQHGVRVTVRLRRGLDINAGCGQLASPQQAT